VPAHPGRSPAPGSLVWKQFQTKEIDMPIILWLLGVPLGIVLLLVLFGVI
jgi:hypothetical protein